MKGLAPSTAVLAFLVAIPAAAAGPSFLFGTEDLPELPDTSGDVQYDPLFVDARDRNYLDVLAAWFEYDNTSDEFRIAIKNADLTHWSFPDWDGGCNIRGNVTVDETILGELVVGVTKYGDDPDFHSYITFEPTNTDRQTIIEGNGSLEHTLGIESTKPGYFRFTVSRSSLLQLGDAIQDFRGRCGEYFTPHLGVDAPIIMNEDLAASSAVYSFTNQRRIAGPDGEPDVFATATTEAAPLMTADDATDTPTPGAFLAAAALGIAAILGLGAGVAASRRKP
jgi:hypothetical protein